MMWYKIENESILITVWVKPNAKKTKLLNITNDALQISLHAKPKKGEANIELFSFISTLLKVPKTHIALIRGDTTRKKILSLPRNSETVKIASSLK